jgi:hypothetical protein
MVSVRAWQGHDLIARVETVATYCTCLDAGSVALWLNRAHSLPVQGPDDGFGATGAGVVMQVDGIRDGRFVER